jgi:Holliday junction resolvasome RuvABC DNA-binding subunit
MAREQETASRQAIQLSNKQPTNAEIADVLQRIADLLEVQDANPHRVRAYRSGADRVRGTDESLAKMVRSGDGEALKELPDIGQGLARVITRYVHTGRSDVLDRLQGEVSPEKLFTQVPGVGQVLAERIVGQLGASTLEELELAAHDGRLAEVEGFGPKRVQSVRVSLTGMLSRAAQRRARRRARGEEKEAQEQPDVGTLLDVDAEYRHKAEADMLSKLAPKRFNPEGKAWLPILHTSRNGWDFTVLYSNTARAHDLGKTRDWVVIYYERDSGEDQAIVVTATHGPLEGKRIVRGREVECEHYYGQEGEP